MTASNIRQYLIRTLMLAVLVQPATAAGLFQGLTSVEAGPRLDDDGVTLVPDGVKSVGERQRTHETELREDGWYVRLRLDGVLESDRFANKRVPGVSGARVVRVDQPVIAA